MAAICTFTNPALAATEQPLPANAVKNLPKLKQALDTHWSTYEYPQFIAGQVEQETCISLKSSKCWSERAELKTAREWGFGFGQLTIAYDKNGKERFNAWADVKKLSPDLRDWTFDNRYDPEKQMIALVVRDKYEYDKLKGVENAYERSAFMFATYNGGSTLRDRALCSATPGCNPNMWFNNVENTSYKSRVVANGYKQSWFEINRAYPVLIMKNRCVKYEPFFNSEHDDESASVDQRF